MNECLLKRDHVIKGNESSSNHPFSGDMLISSHKYQVNPINPSINPLRNPINLCYSGGCFPHHCWCQNSRVSTRGCDARSWLLWQDGPRAVDRCFCASMACWGVESEPPKSQIFCFGVLFSGGGFNEKSSKQKIHGKQFSWKKYLLFKFILFVVVYFISGPVLFFLVSFLESTKRSLSGGPWWAWWVWVSLK